MLSREDLAAMVAAEEKRLGIGSREFMERHGEIMGLAGQAERKNQDAPGGITGTVRGM